MQTSTKFPEPKIERISLNNWRKGVVTNLDDGRTPNDALRSSGNVVLDQNGTIRPRKSLMSYGTQPPGTILGEVFEFVRSSSIGQVNYVIAMINNGSSTRPYIQRDGGTWYATTGKTYDSTARAHFCQVDNKVLVMNGEDNLSYFDIPTAENTRTIIPFTALSTPSAPALTKDGLSGSTFTYHYAITANSTVGETIASVSTTTAVGKERELWLVGTDAVNLTWSAVPSAQSYSIYMGIAADQMFMIATGVVGLGFKDDGSYAKDVTRLAPISDSTAGPKTTRGTIINGQVFMTGDKDNPHFVWFGGITESTILNFSPLGSGGSVEVGRGTKEFPVRIMAFRDGRGQAQITVLCRGTNGMGKRYLLSRESLTVGTQVIDFMSVTEDNGQAGTDSPDGVILYDDSLWYPSRDGFKTTGTRPQLQNILSTNRVSNTIQDGIANLNNSAMDKSVGLGFENKLYWALPVGDTTNNELWVLDLEQKGAWMKPLNVRADWMWLYNDNNGITHFCILQDNQILEFTYAQSTNDNGIPFSTNASSGIIKFSEDGQEWAKVIDVVFVLQRPQGTINVSISGKTEDGPLSTLGSDSYSPETSVSNWGESAWEDYLGWANSETVPTSYGDALAEIPIEIDEELQWWKWDLATQQIGVNYQLSDIIMRFVRIGTKEKD